jgi:hypothetical protein
MVRQQAQQPFGDLSVWKSKRTLLPLVVVGAGNSGTVALWQAVPIRRMAAVAAVMRQGRLEAVARGLKGAVAVAVEIVATLTIRCQAVVRGSHWGPSIAISTLWLVKDGSLPLMLRVL